MNAQWQKHLMGQLMGEDREDASVRRGEDVFHHQVATGNDRSIPTKPIETSAEGAVEIDA